MRVALMIELVGAACNGELRREAKLPGSPQVPDTASSTCHPEEYITAFFLPKATNIPLSRRAESWSIGASRAGSTGISIVSALYAYYSIVRPIQYIYCRPPA